jgi:alanyl-tRNA synthetase
MTDRLYYQDSYLAEFHAEVVDRSADGLRVYLDRTAFYPASGGQPFDAGELSGTRVVEVIDEESRIAHILAEPFGGDAVRGSIDWKRRFDHMQQHTGQHLLSAVFIDLAQATTVSFHMGAESSTIDLACASIEPALLRAVEERSNEVVTENRPVTVTFEHASEVSGLRKASEREGLLRVVSIADLDRSACGGTHVRATGEIGPILLRKLEKVRGNLRVEFLCGQRAVRQARADYDAMASIARLFSSSLSETPALVSAQLERAEEADRARRRLSGELASARGRELYAATAPDADGLRRVVRRATALSDELRTEAQAYTGGAKGAFLVLASEPPSVLLAASPDSGIHAGEWLKAALATMGGRGGGSAAIAQGRVPSPESLETLAERFRS